MKNNTEPKPMYRFNKSSAIKTAIFLSVIIGMSIISLIYRKIEPGFSNYLNGLIIGMMILPILGITKFTWPAIFKEVENKSEKEK